MSFENQNKQQNSHFVFCLMKSVAAILFPSSASRTGIKSLSSKISSMAKTIPIYFEGSSKLECEAVVQSVEAAEGFKEPNCHVVVVDQTVCHPQGKYI